MITSKVEAVENRLNRGMLGYWYVLAKSCDVKHGIPTPAKALGRDLVLWRGDDGKVRCIEDYCPHRGARLGLGRQAGNTLACRYHGIVMDGEGTIVDVPGMKQCALEGRRAIDSYEVREASDAIFVYFPSEAAPRAPDLVLPQEISSDGWSYFLCTAPWKTSYRNILENIADPMHGIFLHGDTFTLSRGVTQDAVAVEPTSTGFIVKRIGQQEVNFDWVQLTLDGPIFYTRVLIPYPPAAGPGGPKFIINFITPIDDHSCRIFFYRTRPFKSDFEREAWRFQFRAKLEIRAWQVIEQDREILEGIPQDARRREMLYQHDMGVTRLRQRMKKHVEAELTTETEAQKAS